MNRFEGKVAIITGGSAGIDLIRIRYDDGARS
jgi:hypothetical protein